MGEVLKTLNRLSMLLVISPDAIYKPQLASTCTVYCIFQWERNLVTVCVQFHATGAFKFLSKPTRYISSLRSKEGLITHRGML